MPWAIVVFLVLGNVFTCFLLVRERRENALYERAFVGCTDLQPCPLFMVSRRNYTERSLYKYPRGSRLGDGMWMQTRLRCLSREFDELADLPDQGRGQSAAEDMLLAQCRLHGEDVVSLRRALRVVLLRYPFSALGFSIPCRVDRARYEGVPCWIVTCVGYIQENTTFSVPVSLDGKMLTPKWREEGRP